MDRNPSILTFQILEAALSGYDSVFVRTANLTQRTPTNYNNWRAWCNNRWQLIPQWLGGTLTLVQITSNPGVTWVLNWPAKLQITVNAGDATRSLMDAWVLVVDGDTGNNITAALTDLSGHSGSITLTDPALIAMWSTDALATGTPKGKILHLGFNLLSGRYVVKVFFKSKDIGGAVDPFGRVDGISVWDTFRDQPQHRYIYLGVTPPATATGEDGSPSQVRTFNTKVYDLRIKVVDQSPAARSIGSAPLTVTAGDLHPTQTKSFTTDASTGELTLTLVPAGKYVIVAKSPVALYGKAASSITATVEVEVTDAPCFALVQLPIFDAVVKMVTPSGRPITGADITVGGVVLGVTDDEGSVTAASIPAGSYTVTATWFGLDISPTTPLTVTASATYTETVSKTARVQIQVVGAIDQGLAGAHVTVKTAVTIIFIGVTDSGGVVIVDLPHGTYSVTVTYNGIEASKMISVTGDMTEKIVTGLFIELLGQPLTFAGFLFCTIPILVVLAIAAFLLLRRRKPSLTAPPPPPPTIEVGQGHVDATLSRSPEPQREERDTLRGALESASGTALLVLGFILTFAGLFFSLFAMLRFTERGVVDLSVWGTAIVILVIGVVSLLISWRLAKKKSHSS